MEQTTMTREALASLIQNIFETTEGNIIGEEIALSPECIGQRMFDAPIFRIGAADDPLFMELKKESVVGPWHLAPAEWLPTAKSVIALFFPFTEEILASNRTQTTEASPAWRHARHDGQLFQNKVTLALKDALAAQGIEACIPAVDPRFHGVNEGQTVEGYGVAPAGHYSSTWSERHACYICGLGTFCLSKGMISEKGLAGRYSTIITELPLAADERPYKGLYDYCIDCGKCAARCPAGAIDPAKGTKDHSLCFNYQAATRHVVPYGGCGLCQTDVPCEHGIPKK